MPKKIEGAGFDKETFHAKMQQLKERIAELKERLAKYKTSSPQKQTTSNASSALDNQFNKTITGRNQYVNLVSSASRPGALNSIEKVGKYTATGFKKIGSFFGSVKESVSEGLKTLNILEGGEQQPRSNKSKAKRKTKKRTNVV
jgi:cell division septum initiation protein DivIVA